MIPGDEVGDIVDEGIVGLVVSDFVGSNTGNSEGLFVGGDVVGAISLLPPPHQQQASPGVPSSEGQQLASEPHPLTALFSYHEQLSPKTSVY